MIFKVRITDGVRQMRLDTLTKLNRKKKMWITPKHPLYFENMDFKIKYSTGIFLHAELNKELSTLNNFELERIIMKGLGLTSSEVSQVIKKSQKAERIVDNMLGILDTLLKKHLFLLDLLSVSMLTGTISEEESRSVDIFSELLGIKPSELSVLKEFINHAYHIENKYCIKDFQKMIQMNMPITMSELKFYLPELEYINKIESKIIKPNNTLLLVDECIINNDIIVPQNTTLIIDNAKVHMNGSIILTGGHLIIRNSELVNESLEKNVLIHVKSFSEVEILQSQIDCRNRCCAIYQENGNLRIIKSIIVNTSKESAIRFWGNQISIEDTKFYNCFVVGTGGALQITKGRGLIKGCSFEECEAKIGGAIAASDEIMIHMCRFIFCKVSEYGAAIYYKGEVKSNVTDCEYIGCYPEKEELIQYIGNQREKTINKEYVIRIATILDCPLHVKEMGILTIKDATIYMNYNIHSKGMIHIKNSRIIAGKIESDYLFYLDWGKTSFIDNCELDGHEKVGVIWANGTKISVSQSIFRNTKKGRAIYDAYEPKIHSCIFSNCHNGAITANAGEMNHNIFVNCRDKSGAGIIIYGTKGTIKDCQFIRCITDYSGGGIDKSGNHKIINCHFEECKPDDIN